RSGTRTRDAARGLGDLRSVRCAGSGDLRRARDQGGARSGDLRTVRAQAHRFAMGVPTVPLARDAVCESRGRELKNPLRCQRLGHKMRRSNVREHDVRLDTAADGGCVRLP
ncbi:MAG: hypothetical protein KDA47_21550, partial [Planctomycetales bacterium]|nr:hypothetical protein [Planctomycetales bacterium]